VDNGSIKEGGKDRPILRASEVGEEKRSRDNARFANPNQFILKNNKKK